MKNISQKSLCNLSVACTLFASSLFATTVQAATFDEEMKLGVINANIPEKEVVIYNEDYTKCLSASSQNSKHSKSLSYATCRMDDADTWVLTSAGKIKNKQTGKCLSTPKGENNLTQSYCNFEYIRDYTAHELVTFKSNIEHDLVKVDLNKDDLNKGELTKDDTNTAEIAKVNY